MKTIKTRSWTVKVETTLGDTKVFRYKAKTAEEAVVITCQEYSLVARLVGVWDSNRVRWM